MGVTAAKESIEQLNIFFDHFGKNPVWIETKDAERWPELYANPEYWDNKEVYLEIGYQRHDGTMADFRLIVKHEDGRIVDVGIDAYEEWFGKEGRWGIGDDNMIHSEGRRSKDSKGLKKRFAEFMEDIVVNGPYLTEPKEVSRCEFEIY